MARARINLSLTETRHFRRLVAFLQDVERHADGECDIVLKDLVEACREDLLHLTAGDE